MHNNRYKAYYLIIPILIMGISFGFTSFLVALAALLPLIFFSEQHTVGFFLLMYGGPLGGVIRSMYPSLPIYGLFLQAVGIFLMWDVVIELLRKNANAIGGVLFVLAIFGFFYIIGPRDSFANNKYSTMVIHGTVMVLGYYAFDSSRRIDVEGLCQILIMTSICMFTFCIEKYNMKPGGLFDYNWFRSECLQHMGKWATGEPLLIGYQQIGMLVLFAAAIFWSQRSMNRGKALFYILCATQLIMMAGARQAILGVLVIIALRLVVFREANIQSKNMLNKLLWSGLGLAAVSAGMLLVLSHSSSSIVTSTLEGGDEDRKLLILEALTIFLNHPMTGAGIGGFNALTEDEWPHNFIIELLCETGLIGTFLLLIVVIYALYKRKAGLMHLTAQGQFYFLFLIALFVRVLVSSDLTESIELFSAVFAISASNSMDQNKDTNNAGNAFNEQALV